MLSETVDEREGKVEYELISIRIVGTYDRQKNEWSLVSKSIGPVGSSPGTR
ncbi:MAG: hypothetical protein IIB53_16205 [Planctomycetes bacterium]|nr:hypothetical protein [Planctomycetota bacterium]